MLNDRHSLKFKIASLALACAILPLGAYHLISVQRSTQALTRSLAQELEAKSVLAAKAINRFIEQSIADAHVLSAAVATLVEDHEGMKSGFLNEMVVRHRWIIDADIVDSDGIVIASSGEGAEIGIDIRTLFPGVTDLFASAREAASSEVLISDVQWLDSGPGLLLVIPVLTNDGTGDRPILFLEVSLQSLEHIILDFAGTIVGSKPVHVIDVEGRVVATTDAGIFTLASLPALERQPEILEKQGTKGSWAYTDRQGEDVIAGFAHLGRLTDSPLVDWTILAVAPLSEIAKPSREIQSILTILCATVAAVSLLIAFALARGIAHPISRVAEVAKAVQAGDYSQRLATDMPGELGQLARTIDTMTERIEERTADLMAANAQLANEVLDRERAERDLKESEERTRAVLESALDCIVTMDRNGRILEFNPAAEACFGFEASAVVGRPMADLLIPERIREAHYMGVKQYLESGETKVLGQRVELEALRADGSEVPVELAVEVVHSNSEPIFVAYLRDISEKRATEQAREEARLQAEQANRSKSEFLAMMSHEIRTPLNGVLGVLGLLRDTKLSGEQAHYIRTARNSADALLDIINDILDFSKIEAGKLDIEVAPFDLGELTGSIVDLLSLRAEEKGIRFSAEMPHEVPRHFRGDAGRLRQALVNLAGNAIKFTDAGSVTIRVALQDTDSETVRLRFAVEDTGIGIAEEHHSSLFSKFTTLEPSYTQKYGGTGLGLAICKRIVDLMGGEIGFSSAPNEGSTFWFVLPLARMTEAEHRAFETAKFESAESPTAGGAPPGSTGRILLAEDHPTNSMIARIVLEKVGYKVDVAANGLEAVEAVRSRPYDLVLMDIGMPEMNGREATKAIRDMPTPATSLPIIAMTAHAMQGDRELLLDSGFDGYLGKPASADQLLQTVARHLGPVAPRGDVQSNGAAAGPTTEARQLLLCRETLEQLTSDLGSEALPAVFSSFVKSTEERLVKIGLAIQASDFDTLEQECHPIAGSAASFGAPALHTIMLRVESLLRGGETQQAIDLCATAEEITRQTLTELARFLDSLEQDEGPHEAPVEQRLADAV